MQAGGSSQLALHLSRRGASTLPWPFGRVERSRSRLREDGAAPRDDAAATLLDLLARRCVALASFAVWRPFDTRFGAGRAPQREGFSDLA